MSGHYSRKRYDDCYYGETVKQSVRPLSHQLDLTQAENDDKCFHVRGPAPSRHGELPTKDRVFRTQVETYLRNIDMPDSRCMPNYMLAEKDRRLRAFVSKDRLPFNQCKTEQLDYQASRLDLPVHVYRSATINRYEFPIIPPQDTVYFGITDTTQVNNDRHGINTRLRLKDTLRVGPRRGVKA